jgi:hypothetical protein
MHLRSIEINDIRSLKTLRWALPSDQDGAGWHVILGDNGSGKSSFMQAVALALIGPDEARAARQDFRQWLRRPRRTAGVSVKLQPHPEDKWRARGKQSNQLTIRIKLEPSEDDSRIVHMRGPENRKSGPYRALWSDKPGWFSAGFGPFRRFRGGESDSQQLFKSNPKLAPHLSVFSEGIALGESLAWLSMLRIQSLQTKTSDEKTLLEVLTRFINRSQLLPHGIELAEVTTDAVQFRDVSGANLSVMALSDGFRSMLSLTFELLRLLDWSYGRQAVIRALATVAPATSQPSINLPGVVLIDEVDAHLHPTWQHRIGQWFTHYFPKMQFIVTTHSPIICQAASPGSAYKLPTPGTDEEGRMLQGEELKRLVYGSVLDAFRTSAFDPAVTRSEDAKVLIDELAQLNVKEIAEGLSAAEQRRQEQLRGILPGLDPRTV